VPRHIACGTQGNVSVDHGAPAGPSRRDPVKPIPNKKPAAIRHDGDGREALAAPHRRFESLDFVLIQEHGWFQLEV